MYTGSMMGCGAMMFAVWPYVIAHMKPNRDRSIFTVELNTQLMALLIGESEEDIAKIIAQFCEPDLKSRTPDKEGRKLVKLGAYLYEVVNGSVYDEIRREAELRESNRRRQERHYYKNAPAKSALPLSPVNPPAVPPDASSLATSPMVKRAQRVLSVASPEAVAIYEAYPRRVARKPALKAIGEALKKMDFEKLLAITKQYAEAKSGADLKYVPHPATWFNAEGFFDDPAMWNLPEVVNGAPRKPSLPEREMARLLREQAAETEAAECRADKTATIDMSWMAKKMKPQTQEANEA